MLLIPVVVIYVLVGGPTNIKSWGGRPKSIYRRRTDSNKIEEEAKRSHKRNGLFMVRLTVREGGGVGLLGPDRKQM